MNDYEIMWKSLVLTLDAERKALRGNGFVADVLEVILSHMVQMEKVRIIDVKCAARRKEVTK